MRMPKCNESTMRFINAIREQGEEKGGEYVLDMGNYVFTYSTDNTDPWIKRVVITESDNLNPNLLYRKRTFEVSNNSEESIWDLIGDYELDFKICDCCGAPMDSGYYNEDRDWYACDEACFESLMYDNYGTLWKKANDPREGTYYEAYDKEQEEWFDVDAYYTEWF